VYGGASRETPATDAAAAATTGQFVSYQGVPALTQFSSSSGGQTSVGSQPYLTAAVDPYDGWAGNPNHDWSTTVAASKIQKAYPSIGTLKQLTITRRAGGGAWGGRVGSLTLVGSRKSIVITGNDARWAFGLKSNWFGF
jgi:SpoIID/LytB domain protein